MNPSIIRTAVPYVVGVLLALAARVGLDLPETALTEVVTAVLVWAAGTGYYIVSRFLERRLSPRARRIGRWLLSLGLTKQTPAYVPSAELDQARAARHRS